MAEIAKSDKFVSIIAGLLGLKCFIIGGDVNFVFSFSNACSCLEVHWNFSVFLVNFVSSAIIEEYLSIKCL
jgi:hypothetical protein